MLVCGFSNLLTVLTVFFRILRTVMMTLLSVAYVSSCLLFFLSFSAFSAVQVRFGVLSEQSIGTLRLLRDAFGVVFKIKKDDVTTVSHVPRYAVCIVLCCRSGCGFFWIEVVFCCCCHITLLHGGLTVA